MARLVKTGHHDIMAKQISAPRLQPYRSGEPQRKPLTTGARSLHHAPPNLEGQTCVSARPVLHPHSSCLPLWGRCPSGHTGAERVRRWKDALSVSLCSTAPPGGSQGVRLSKSRRGRCPHRPGAQTWQVSTSSVSLARASFPSRGSPWRMRQRISFSPTSSVGRGILDAPHAQAP